MPVLQSIIVLFIGIVIFTIITKDTNVAGQRLCGRRLTEALGAVCQNNYNTPRPNKRSDELYEYEYQVPADEPVYMDNTLLGKLLPNMPFRTRLRRNVHAPREVYALRGIVDECCYKSCRIEELQQYCAHPITRPSRQNTKN